MRRSVSRTAVALLAVACLLSAGAGGPATAAGGGFGGPLQTGAVGADAVVLRVDVAANGAATWTIEYRVRLDDADTAAAFDDFAADVRANRTAYESRFGDRMSRTAGVAENATGRSMRIENVSVAAERRQLPREYGVVSYRFRWVGFAAVDGERVEAGDALSGFFLDAETRLILSWPSGYEATDVTPAADETGTTTVTWHGPTDFGPDEPRVALAPSGGSLAPLGAVGALLAALFVGGTFAWYRRRGREVVEGGGATAAATGAGRPEEAGESEAPDEELLSPAERVVRFVEERGGRVKQQEVVQRFDWTAARTSQVVGSLRDDGEIETFRLGRENVITLPDDDDGEEFGDPTPDPNPDPDR